jgi:reverse gyrase
MLALPKKNKRIEADLDTKVAERVRVVHPHKNWALEVKIEGRERSKSSIHQNKALKQVENGKFLYKIPDMGKRNPFDFVCLGDADAILCTIAKNKRDVCCIVNGHYEFNIRI